MIRPRPSCPGSTTPTNRPTARRFQYDAERVKRRGVPVVTAAKRDHDAFPDFAQWASRSELNPCHPLPTRPYSPPDRFTVPTDPTDRPGDVQRSSRPRARCEMRDKGICYPTRWHAGPLLSKYRTCEGSERRYQVLQSHLFIFESLHCLLEWRREAQALPK
jgi:hypothetical protein